MKKLVLTSMLMALSLLSAYGSAEPVDVPFDEVWDRSIEKILDLDGIPTYRDKEIGIIRTEKFLMKLDRTTVDCGKEFFIPVMKDKRVRNWVSYEIRLRTIKENSTDVRVLTVIEGYLFPLKGYLKEFDKNRSEYSEWRHFKSRFRFWEDPNHKKNCKSTGELEKQFIASIRGD